MLKSVVEVGLQAAALAQNSKFTKLVGPEIPERKAKKLVIQRIAEPACYASECS
jgi:hypothetical protein